MFIAVAGGGAEAIKELATHGEFICRYVGSFRIIIIILVLRLVS